MKSRTRSRSSQGTSRSQKWEFPLGSEHDPAPQTKARCLREIAARFVDPHSSETLLGIPSKYGNVYWSLSPREVREFQERGCIPDRIECARMHSRAQLRAATLHTSSLRYQRDSETMYSIPDEDIDAHIRRRSSLHCRPRPEILCVEFDSTPDEEVDEYLATAKSLGLPTLKVWSGALPGWYGRQHVGWHTHVIAIDALHRMRLLQEALAIGGTYLQHTDRIPGFPYRSTVVHLDKTNRWGAKRLRDAAQRRLVIEHQTLDMLQDVVMFLRQIPDAARAAGMSAEEVEEWYATWSPGRPVDYTCASDDDTASSVEDRTRSALSEWLSTLIEQGDIHQRYRHPDGRLDRSAMGMAVLRGLHSAGRTADEAWALTEQGKPGLAKYTGDRNGLNSDWKRICKTPTEPIARRKARIVAAAMQRLNDPVERMVMVTLCSLRGRPSPGYRELGKMIGVDKMVAFYAVRRLIAAGWLRKHGRVVLPGEGPRGQHWDLLLPENSMTTNPIYSLLCTEERQARFLDGVRELLSYGVPLRPWFGPDADDEAVLYSLLWRGAEDLLSMLSPIALAKQKIAYAKRERTYRNDRAEHRARINDLAASRGGDSRD